MIWKQWCRGGNKTRPDRIWPGPGQSGPGKTRTAYQIKLSRVLKFNTPHPDISGHGSGHGTKNPEPGSVPGFLISKTKKYIYKYWINEALNPQFFASQHIPLVNKPHGCNSSPSLVKQASSHHHHHEYDHLIKLVTVTTCMYCEKELDSL